MAKKSRNKSTSELKGEIARSRDDLALRLNRVREEADVSKKIRRSVRREPVPWIVGAIAVGLIITAVVTRKKKVVVDVAPKGHKARNALLETGFLLGALRVAASLLKPLVVKFVADKFGSYKAPGRPNPKGF